MPGGFFRDKLRTESETSILEDILDALDGNSSQGRVMTVSDTVVNASSVAVTLKHLNGGGTPTTGMGVEVDWNLPSSTNVERVAAKMRAVWTAATNGAEAAEWRLSLMTAGAHPGEGSEPHRFTPTRYLGPLNDGSTYPSICTGFSDDGIGNYAGHGAIGIFTLGSVRAYFSAAELGLAAINIKAIGAVKIGTLSTETIAFWGATPVAQYATTGTSATFVAGGGTTVTHLSTFTGATGSTAYTIGDIVKCLKLAGFMAQ